LQNSEKLKSYKISDDNVIHLVAKCVEENQNNTNQNNSNQTQSDSTERINMEDILPSLIEFPVLRSARRQRRRRLPHFDLSECFESMHQNLSTMQNLVNCKNRYDEQQILQNRTIIPFDFSKAKFEVGQWVDVKDTIDQWLEAQVIQVRNNQAYVHYNGWGTRWDEWIDFSSPRIAPFKTYTMQSPTSVFLSPYPSVACDANVEPQHRTIDSFFYMDKVVNFMSEISRIVEYMSKLRKKNSSKSIEDKKPIKKDDFELEEIKDKENQSRNLNNPNFNSNDYEVLFCISQLIPLMDRSGRMLSDISLNLSHLILNPNLYPQLLLGYTQNVEVSDNMSCTSGYSMYTNEGSALSGFNPNVHEQNILNNLQRGNIVNSNQMINNYNLTSISSNNNFNPNLNSNLNTNSTNTNYILNSSSNELPFIQRLQTSNTNINNNTNLNIQHSNFDLYPKINLQIPSLLSPGEVIMFNGFSPLNEPNIDIYVHTLVTSNNPNINTTNIVNSNSNNTIQVNNENSNANNINIGTSNSSNNIASTNDNELINNLTNNPNRNAQNVPTNSRTVNPTSSSSTGLSNLLENLMTMIGRGGQTNRRGSPTSDRSSNSTGRVSISNSLTLNPNNIQVSSNRDRINVNQRSVIQPNPLRNPQINNNPLFKESFTQTDMPINLLSLQKENK
jgi:hypothetical protein